VLLNTERAGASVTATDIEERVEQLFFDLPGATPPPAPASSAPLQRYIGQYRDNAGLVRLSTDGKTLTAKPGVHHRIQSRLVPEGGGLFFAEDEPSYALRFQTDGDRTRGYGRYHNGWFVGLAARSSGSSSVP